MTLTSTILNWMFRRTPYERSLIEITETSLASRPTSTLLQWTNYQHLEQARWKHCYSSHVELLQATFETLHKDESFTRLCQYAWLWRPSQFPGEASSVSYPVSYNPRTMTRYSIFVLKVSFKHQQNKTNMYATHRKLAPYRLRGWKNRPTPFPGQMLYKATKPAVHLCCSPQVFMKFCSNN